MISKKTALKEAARFAAALDGPLGPRSMQRVICEFQPFFRNLRATRASWGQIAVLLASAGVRTRSGQPLKEAVIRAMVSRAEREDPVKARAESPAANDYGRRAATGSVISTPVQQPGHSALQRRPADAANPALGDVKERIRRASVLRTSGGARHG